MQAADARLKTFRQGSALSICRKKNALRFRFCRQQPSACLRAENKNFKDQFNIFASSVFARSD